MSPVEAMSAPWTGAQSMLYLSGSKRAFRCDNSDGRHACGGNVFTRHAENSLRYRCNSCGATYAGERTDCDGGQ